VLRDRSKCTAGASRTACQRSAGLGLLPSLRNLKSGLLRGLVHCQGERKAATRLPRRRGLSERAVKALPGLGLGLKIVGSRATGRPVRCAPACAWHSRSDNTETGLPRRSIPLTRRRSQRAWTDPTAAPWCLGLQLTPLSRWGGSQWAAPAGCYARWLRTCSFAQFAAL
jgi:hypothetical protein